MTIPPRYIPCSILQEARIPCVVWFEDALWHYGVPTGVFDLYLLVPDIDQAAKALLHQGWNDTPPPSKFIFHFLASHPEITHRRLCPPGANKVEPPRWPPTPPGEVTPKPGTTILLRAADFHFPTKHFAPTPTSLEGYFPPLPVLINTLIDSLLEAPHGSRLQGAMALQVCYLYEHVHELKERSFSKEIKYENRQFHHDALLGLDIGTLPVLAAERRIRDELRKEQGQLEEYQAYTSELNNVV
ncbi:hypothetical protein ACRALDRAFT_1065392 [Sodiomyces alcalophilus JCM 7366]|uniref:uncharacterized protein n=1 Tax=Sodiomyces alcalophilus JCM 7366 TaxID=591952 RepID=UPI0039B4CFD4